MPFRQFLASWFVYLLVLVAFEIIADILAKEFALRGNLVFAVFSIVGYILANVAWLISLRSGGELSKGSVIFSALNGIVAIIIGLLIYHEKANPYQLIGLVRGVLAIVFLSM
jgi:multidrug transporter EmrE-like cation transporter